MIERGKVRATDFSGIVSGRRLHSVHPGEVLLKEFIEPMGITRYRVAANIGVPQRRIDLICRGESAVSAGIALRLAQLFGTSAQFWMNLQAQHELEQTERASGDRIRAAVVPLPARLTRAGSGRSPASPAAPAPSAPVSRRTGTRAP